MSGERLELEGKGDDDEQERDDGKGLQHEGVPVQGVGEARLQKLIHLRAALAGLTAESDDLGDIVTAGHGGRDFGDGGGSAEAVKNGKCVGENGGAEETVEQEFQGG